DHSKLGADEAELFCLEHGLSHYDAHLVGWLVKHHLLMSLTSQRKDISDPIEVNAFADKVGNLNRLNYLYLLTVADIRATNPTLWNTWKDSLLKELYHAAKRVLQRGLNNPLAREELISEVKQASLHLLRARGLEPELCRRLWEEFDEEYFLRHSDEEIAWHTGVILQCEPADHPLVAIRQLPARGSTAIFIYAQDYEHLFAHITSALARLGLNVLDARITTTTAGYTLDTFLVLDESGKPIEEPYKIEETAATLRQLLQQPGHSPPEVARRVSRRLRHFDVPTRVVFDTASNRRHTVLELVTADQPGLLSRIGKAFTDCNVLVHNARITTIGEQAEDVFLITDLKQRPIDDERHLALIRDCLLRRLGKSSEYLAPLQDQRDQRDQPKPAASTASQGGDSGRSS
ncbi:MAG TPA: [protein-PII] uridylyltransferase, partial [Gammaproteobacteria bacterium]|nr:[protein-PII] uridylyltransferase [Gammaproteobacteria bacterium]